LEMQGVLAFCLYGFLSIYADMCKSFATTSLLWWFWSCPCVGAPRAVERITACFSPRRRHAPKGCTAFFKLDLRFT